MEMFAGQVPIIGRGYWTYASKLALVIAPPYLSPTDWDKAHRQPSITALYLAKWALVPHISVRYKHDTRIIVIRQIRESRIRGISHDQNMMRR